MTDPQPQVIRRVQISALATSVPPRVLTNSELEQMVDTSNEWILKRTGIRERHIADDDVATSIWRPRRRWPRSHRRV